MSLEHAILGFLSYEPLSGYDLKRIFDRSVSHFWPAVQSQIYKSLMHMEALGWLEVETISQAPRPPRKLYHLTPAGEAELMRWLQEPQPLHEVRLPWLIQVFFAGQLPDEHVLSLLRHQLNLQKQRLQGYAAIPPDNQADMNEADPRQRFFWLLTVDFGVSQALAQVRWLEEVIRRIEQGDYRLPTLES
jgi:DNA-binding PadR family transcriptional regulator